MTRVLRLVRRISDRTGGRRRATHRLFADCVAYALGEGAAFGCAVPLLAALLGGRTADAAWWLVPVGCCVLVCWVAMYDLELCGPTLTRVWRGALYEAIGEHLVRLPLGWFDDTRSGQVDRVLAKDVNTVSFTPLLVQAFTTAVLSPATTLVFLLVFDWRIALAAVVTAPVVVAVFVAARRFADRSDTAHDAAGAEASARLVEFAGAQPVLRAYGGAGRGRALLDDALAAQHHAARRQVLAALPGQHLGALAVQLAFTAVLSVGLLILTGSPADPAAVLAVVVIGIRLLTPVSTLAGAAGATRVTEAALDRIAAVLDVAPLPEPATPRTPVGAAIELSGVCFGYADTPVLDGLDLRVPAGSTVALVGASGAGKSTVTKLVARFFDVAQGSVRVGGVDVRELDGATLQRSIAMIFQDVYLMDGTIEDNIRFGMPDADDARVRDAARRARVDEIAARLPDGWASRVGAGGRLLSGGERQRVAIARALVKDAPTVLVDEATSALDGANEAAIRDAIAELGRSSRTVLVIAHRLSTIAGADLIAVLAEGRIVESGRHEELIAAGGHYARLWAERDRARGWRLTGS